MPAATPIRGNYDAGRRRSLLKELDLKAGPVIVPPVFHEDIRAVADAHARVWWVILTVSSGVGVQSCRRALPGPDRLRFLLRIHCGSVVAAAV